MRLDVAAIDGKLIRNGPGSRHLLEDTLPDAALRPPVVTIVDCGWRTIGWRHVAPAAAGLENMQDARNHPAIINPGFARLAARKMRFHRPPRLIRQPK